MLGILAFCINLLSIVSLADSGAHPTEKRTNPIAISASENARSYARDTMLINTFCDAAFENLFYDSYRAARYAQKALKLSQKHNYTRGQVMVYHILGNYYLINADYDILTQVANEGYSLAEKGKMDVYKAHSLRFMAECQAENKDIPAAEASYLKALAIYTEANNDSLIALCHENYGNLKRLQKQYDKAKEHYAIAYKLFGKIGSDWGTAVVTQSEAYLYLLTEEYDKSEMLFLKAYDLFIKIGNRYGKLNLLNDICNLYYSNNNNEQAIATATTADSLADLYQSLQQSNWSVLTLYRTYKRINNAEKALFYLEKMDYNRRMMRAEKIERRASLFHLAYDIRRKDLELQQSIIEKQETTQRYLIGFSIFILVVVVVLWWQNKLLRLKNLRIQEALLDGQTLERKRVAAELHDNLGSSLAAINWYLYGMDKGSLSEKEKNIYEQVHEMIGSAYKEIRNLSHNLLPEELERDGLERALQRLKTKLNDNKKIKFDFDIFSIKSRLDRKIEFELYSIILELTNNILKHSGATLATLVLQKSDSQITVNVTDNGRGIDSTDTKGVGLRNVRSRVESMKGKLDINVRENGGTEVIITIPGPTGQHLAD
jgi:NarL family two-component system sensor histidine kinase LiaS